MMTRATRISSTRRSSADSTRSRAVLTPVASADPPNRAPDRAFQRAVTSGSRDGAPAVELGVVLRREERQEKPRCLEACLEAVADAG